MDLDLWDCMTVMTRICPRGHVVPRLRSDQGHVYKIVTAITPNGLTDFDKITYIYSVPRLDELVFKVMGSKPRSQ